jgi:hypothetical protein
MVYAEDVLGPAQIFEKRRLEILDNPKTGNESVVNLPIQHVVLQLGDSVYFANRFHRSGP